MTADRSGAMSFATPSDLEVVVTRFVEAPVEEVFDAWTIPEHVTQWMLGPPGYTMPVCEIDLRTGGAWHFVWRGPGASKLEMDGEYREIVRPERLVSIERWGDPWPETLNVFEFSEEDDGTTIICTVVYPTKGARDAAIETGMQNGMADSFNRLAEYLG
jgi:uncharacterized protein YndB with AHSA1/START domain